MRDMQFASTPTDDEIAAALAAVGCFIEQRALDEASLGGAEAPPARPWSTAAALAAQGLPPTLGGVLRGWNTAERATRASNWSYGVVGM